jgi:predicted solute-binding protein
MKNFKKFMEDVPSTSTTSVAGAGDNPEKIVPVHMKKKRKKDIEVLKRFIDKREDSQKKWSR